MPKTVPALPGIPPSRYPFSEVVEANGFVFLAGQVGDVARPGRRRPGGIEAETRQMLENVGRAAPRGRPRLRRRREVHGLPARLQRVRRDERGLPRVLPDRAADPGDGRGDRAGRGLPGRDRGAGDPLSADRQSLDAITGGRANSSMATIGRPFVPTTSMRQRCCRPAFQPDWKTLARASKTPRYRSTVLTYVPSR